MSDDTLVKRTPWALRPRIMRRIALRAFARRSAKRLSPETLEYVRAFKASLGPHSVIDFTTDWASHADLGRGRQSINWGGG